MPAASGLTHSDAAPVSPAQADVPKNGDAMSMKLGNSAACLRIKNNLVSQKNNASGDASNIAV